MKVELRTVVLDITKHCNRVPKHIKQIYEVHLYDEGVAVHCCEITPSAELHHVATDFVAAESYWDLSDEQRDKVYEYVMEVGLQTEEVSYIHMSQAKRASRKCREFDSKFSHAETREEFMEEIREDLCGNPEPGVWEEMLNENTKERS